MQLHAVKQGKYLVITASGRLDSSWSDYVSETFLSYIREGEHNIVVEATGLSFLSSAGIRSLVRIYKEITSVRGSFMLKGASEFVAHTLETTGFGDWLSNDFPPDLVPLSLQKPLDKHALGEIYELNASASFDLTINNGWQAWQKFDSGMQRQQKFNSNSFALGIGSSTLNVQEAKSHFGEFLVAGGNLAFLLPEEKGHPDYMLPEKDFIPEMITIQSLTCTGEISHLFRFTPDENGAPAGISELASRALDVIRSEVAGLIIIAETAGLTGVNLIRSPGLIDQITTMEYPDIKKWLSFCGEKVYAGELAVIFGVVATQAGARDMALLKPLMSNPELHAHFHAAVFPFQPVQNGIIDIKQQTERIFNGAPPRGLLHLIDDNRPTMGLGESTLVRGACWCSPVKNMEELI
jgi:anti-anti-sigma factor